MKDGNVYPLKKTTNVRVSKVVPGTPVEARLRKDNRLPQEDPIDIPKVDKLRKSRNRNNSYSDEEVFISRQLKVFFLFLVVLVALSLYHNYVNVQSTENNTPSYDFFSGFTFPEFFGRETNREDVKLRDFIHNQFESVNQRINDLILHQFTQSEQKLSHRVNTALYDVNRDIKRLQSSQSSAPTKEDLESINVRMHEIVAMLEKDSQSRSNEINQEIKSIHTQIVSFSNRIESTRSEIAKHNIYSDQITSLTNQLQQTGSHVNVLDREFQELRNSNSRTHIDSQNRITQLEARVTNLENTYITRKETERKFAELQKHYETLQPLTVMDVNSLVSEYLKANGIQKFDEEAIFRMISEYTASHGVTLNQLRAEDYQMLRDQISTHAVKEMQKIFYEDDIGKPDFALGAVGAKVIDYTGKWAINNLLDVLLPFGEKPHPPSIVLEGHKEVGDCWAFHGSKAFISVRLSSKIVPDSISLDHIASSIAHTPNLTSAPKEFRAFGFAEEGSEPILLGNFAFDRNGAQVQNFLVDEQAKDHAISVVRIEFISNYGNSYTCVYRIRVHGSPASIRN